MNVRQLAAGITLAGLLGAGSGALAATDGTLGATSDGTLDVSLAVSDRVMISGLDDIPLGGYTGSGDLVGSSEFCVYRNGTGLYDVTVTSAHESAGAFRATNGVKFVPYAVNYDVDTDASDGTALSSGAAQTGLAGHASSSNCGASDNASIEVTFVAADLTKAQSGAYTDTLTLLVTPN